MSLDVPVIDLGEVDARTVPGIRSPRPRPVRSKTSSAFRVPSQVFYREPPRSGLLASVSLFLPGAGQMLARKLTWGLFFCCSLSFLCALGRSIVVSIDRLTVTLTLLELPPMGALWVLPCLYITAGVLHIGSVLHAHGLGSPWRRDIHPFWSTLASVLVPGWGQVLNGNCGRAAFFLGSLWTLGAGGILISPLGRRMLSIAHLELPPAVRPRVAIFALLAAFVVVWAIAIYDAFVLAKVRRGP